MYIDGCCWHDCKKSAAALAFVLVEGENNESWSWFLHLVRKQVLSPDRHVYMIWTITVVCLTVLKNILRGTHHLYTGDVYIILPQIFGRSNEAKRLSSG
jgi:hypothetical protein